MEEILIKYKRLKRQLAGEAGCEDSVDAVIWNEGILGQMEELLKDVPKNIAQMIRMGHL